MNAHRDCPASSAKPSRPRGRLLRAGVSVGVLLVTPALFGAGCESETEGLLKALGEGCLINSDCDDTLVCVFRRCHEECESSADCPLAATGERLRCVVGESPSHVCQLDDERECDYSSQCPDTQLCGPDGQCRDICAGDRDCVDVQVCTQGVCAEPEEVSPDNPYLPQAPRPDDQVTGLPCEYSNECLGLAPEGGPEFVCRDGICAFDCFLDIDCDPNTICSPQDDDATTPGTCVLGDETGPFYCIPGEQRACECPGGELNDGLQICEDSGLRFAACEDFNGDPC